MSKSSSSKHFLKSPATKKRKSEPEKSLDSVLIEKDEKDELSPNLGKRPTEKEIMTAEIVTAAMEVDNVGDRIIGLQLTIERCKTTASKLEEALYRDSRNEDFQI